MVEALLYQKLSDASVRCEVCHNFCIIPKGKRGICGVRENQDGVLFALNYGLTIASAIDPIEKKPLFHFLPNTKVYSLATVGCNLRCSWCQNYEISQSPKSNSKIQGIYISPEEHVSRAIRFGCPSIAYTYSEPTIFFEYALDIMIRAKREGLKNVWVTNGYMTKAVLELILPYLDAANVDYKGPDDAVYRSFCGGLATPIMENMKLMQANDVHLEITTLIVPGVNDDKDQIRKIASSIVRNLGKNVPWHITRFFPAWKMSDVSPTEKNVLDQAKQIGIEEGINTIYLGNI